MVNTCWGLLQVPRWHWHGLVLLTPLTLLSWEWRGAPVLLLASCVLWNKFSSL